MPTIVDVSQLQKKAGVPFAVWRDELLPAHFDGCMFHVESGGYEGGRRIASHEFPKKELGYAEDMGRKATQFTVRGYVIVYPHDDANAPDLYRRDYRIARDALQIRLDKGGPGVLQLPTYLKQTKLVVCTQFRMTEEDKYGGFCTFDMSFIERGVRPFQTQQNTAQDLVNQSNALKMQVVNVWQQQSQRTPEMTKKMQARLFK